MYVTKTMLKTDYQITLSTLERVIASDPRKFAIMVFNGRHYLPMPTFIYQREVMHTNGR